MADMQIYSNAYSTINGAVLSQATEITINKNPQMNPVATMALGLAGVTLGAGMCEVTLDTAVPSADFEFNPDAFMRTGRLVEVGAVMASRQMQSKMFVTGASYKAGVNASSGCTITFLGALKDWE